MNARPLPTRSFQRPRATGTALLTTLLLGASWGAARAQQAPPPQATPPPQAAPVPTPAPPTPNAATSGPTGGYSPNAPLGNNGLPVRLPVRPLRIGIGVLLPVDNTVSTRTSNTHFAVGGTLDLVETPRQAFSLYADGSLYNHSTKAMNMAGGGVSFRSYLFPEGPYLGLGVGAYYLDYKDPTVDGNRFGLGGKVLAGFDFPGGAFVEANYTAVPEVKHRDMNNLQLLVGYRF